VARRDETRQRTARANVDDLCEPGTFVEYGPLVIAAQRRRRPVEDLIARTPADGLVAGIGRVNGHLFDEPRSRCVVMAYDYTVLAGTQGSRTIARRIACSSSPRAGGFRSCSSPKVAAGGPGTPTAPASPGSTAGPSTTGAG
jgi:acetyl-CoA carboxylase carboxyltransferase component